MLPTRDTFSFKDTYRCKMKRYKKIFFANGNKKRAKIAILVSGKLD